MDVRMDARQLIKLVVYSLLVVNFILYLADDLQASSHIMRDGDGFLKWTASFATTIDVGAWLVLLFLFELETYLLSDQTLDRPGVTRLMHGLRLLCYLLLTHSVYAFGIIYYDLLQVSVIENVDQLCQLVGSNLFFVRNLEYTQLTLQNCTSLSDSSQFYLTRGGLVVTDASGLKLETQLALVDFLEVVFWLLILLSIEVMVRLQDRAIIRGNLVLAIKAGKILLYAALWGFAAWWLALGHFHYAWDEALWIVGFFAIEGNMAQWKREIEASDDAATTEMADQT